jgi:hypothetical protein
VSSVIVAIRRTVLLVVLAAVVGAVVSQRRSTRSIPEPRSAPVWPPLGTTPTDTTPTDATPTDTTPLDATPTDTTPLDARPTDTTPTVADATSTSGVSWLPANADGSLPHGHLVKAKDTSRIFHVPGGRFYDRTTPDRCYRSAADAEADGYRRSKT